jgi:hypothetical protein
MALMHSLGTRRRGLDSPATNGFPEPGQVVLSPPWPKAGVYTQRSGAAAAAASASPASAAPRVLVLEELTGAPAPAAPVSAASASLAPAAASAASASSSSRGRVDPADISVLELLAGHCEQPRKRVRRSEDVIVVSSPSPDSFPETLADFPDTYVDTLLE